MLSVFSSAVYVNHLHNYRTTKVAQGFTCVNLLSLAFAILLLRDHVACACSLLT
jgi:hypothetical protein